MEILSVTEITGVADSGYYREAQLAACQEANATVYVPIPNKHQAVASQGRLSGERFYYNPAINA